MSDANPTRVLRKTLEEALDTDVASAVLFEAVGASGAGVPRTKDDVLQVLRGPLKQILVERLGAAEAILLVARVEGQLAPADDDLSTVEVPLEELASEGRPEEATTAFPTADRAVPVLVVASGPSFATKLELALGDRRVAPSTAVTQRMLERALGEDPPALMVVDATDLPQIDDAAVLRAARALPKTTACVLFGAELPYGKRLAAAIAAQDRQWVTLERREGVAPLLDLIRSRRKSRA